MPTPASHKSSAQSLLAAQPSSLGGYRVGYFSDQVTAARIRAHAILGTKLGSGTEYLAAEQALTDEATFPESDERDHLRVLAFAELHALLAD
jgi:hypothetical protein